MQSQLFYRVTSWLNLLFRRWRLPCSVLISLLLIGCATANRPLQLVGGAGQIYPAAALEQGIEGFVTVRYGVNVTGQVVDARVIESEPAGVFDQAALDAVRSWRFNPPVLDGVKQPAQNLQSTLTFKLGATDAYDNY